MDFYEKTTINHQDEIDVNTRIIFPTEPLQKYIRFFFILENNDDSFIKEFKIIPDGLPGLIFQENPKVFRYRDNQVLPEVFLYGQAIRYSHLNVHGSFKNIGVAFQPTALKSVFGIDACELTGSQISITDITNISIYGQLIDTKSPEQKIKMLENFFLRQIENHIKGVNKKIDYASVQLQKGKGLKQVQTELNLSERSLERLFKSHIGISPKLYSRICRFQDVLEILRKADCASLTEIAHLKSYFDQSHFIRDFKFFTASTPKHFWLNAREHVPNLLEWEF